MPEQVAQAEGWQRVGLAAANITTQANLSTRRYTQGPIDPQALRRYQDVRGAINRIDRTQDLTGDLNCCWISWKTWSWAALPMPDWQMGKSPCASASMPYEVAFPPEALREWRTLTAGIREQFKKKLAERLIESRIPASKLRGSSHR